MFSAVRCNYVICNKVKTKDDHTVAQLEASSLVDWFLHLPFESYCEWVDMDSVIEVRTVRVSISRAGRVLFLCICASTKSKEICIAKEASVPYCAKMLGDEHLRRFVEAAQHPHWSHEQGQSSDWKAGVTVTESCI